VPGTCLTPYASPFDFTPEEWVALGAVLEHAKRAWDERLAPDGYFLSWRCYPQSADAVPLPGSGRARLFGPGT
jgi:hypothetical protein